MSVEKEKNVQMLKITTHFSSIVVKEHEQVFGCDNSGFGLTEAHWYRVGDYLAIAGEKVGGKKIELHKIISISAEVEE